LPLLTKQIYGTPDRYLDIARFNHLDNFRRLTPGRTLVFPSLARLATKEVVPLPTVTPTILSNGQPMDPSYRLLSIDVRREVNRLPQATPAHRRQRGEATVRCKRQRLLRSRRERRDQAAL